MRHSIIEVSGRREGETGRKKGERKRGREGGRVRITLNLYYRILSWKVDTVTHISWSNYITAEVAPEVISRNPS